MRLGGPGMGQLPPSDPKVERDLANAAVIGNAMTFAFIVGTLHFLPYVLEPMGFDVLV